MVLHTLFWLSCFAIVAGGNPRDVPYLRIVGGKESTQRYGFMISLQTYEKETNKYYHRCGGSIVYNDCIVTAAHCVANSSYNIFSVYVGTNNLDDPSGERYFLRGLVVHPGYKELAENDIAVLKVDKVMTFSDRVNAIEQSTEYIGGGIILRLIGWGYTERTKLKPLPRKLQEIDTKSITNDECNMNVLYKATETDMCTHDVGEGASNGDSGGPLFKIIGGRFILVGVVSRGFRISAVPTMPDIYLRASLFVEWINEQCNKP